MTGPYITSLLSIPVSDETVVEKGVVVSRKKSRTCWFIAELSRARTHGQQNLVKYPSQKIGYDVAYAHPYTHFM